MASTTARIRAKKAKADAGTALDKIGSATEQAVSSVAAAVVPAVTDAKEKVAPALIEAKEKAAPVAAAAVEDAKVRLVPAVEQAKAKAAPAAAAALESGRARGRRAAVRLGVVEEKKKSHKLRNLLVLLGLGGVAALVYTKLTGKNSDDAWKPSREVGAPPVAPAATTSGGVAVSIDESETAPTAPLASEEHTESPVPTTPDQPLTEKNL